MVDLVYMVLFFHQQLIPIILQVFTFVVYQFDIFILCLRSVLPECFVNLGLIPSLLFGLVGGLLFKLLNSLSLKPRMVFIR